MHNTHWWVRLCFNRYSPCVVHVQAVNLVRHAYREPLPADAAPCSRVVTCGNICYTSAIRSRAAKEVADDAAPAEYEAQTADVSGWGTRNVELCAAWV